MEKIEEYENQTIQGRAIFLVHVNNIHNYRLRNQIYGQGTSD